MYFNPRSREGSDGLHGAELSWLGISIHAPARGATPGTSDPSFLLIFQSTLPRGERPRHSISYRTRSYFNPRSREGSDFAFAMFYTSIFYFNPRSREGSDAVWVIISIKNTYFNPRSREGSDGIHFASAAASSPFQSTLPRGERPASNSSRFLSSNFNPRSREGSDSAFPQATYVYSSFQSTLPRGERLWLRENCDKFGVISIHAPARGATTSVLFPANKIEISIHAPARGATAFRSSYYFRVRISIHAPARGATHYHGMSMTDYRIFQSTLPRGERLNFALPATRLHYFNPRSREGSD